MKIAFLSQAWPSDETVSFSGSSVQVYYVAQQLAKLGHQVLVILSSHEGYSGKNENIEIISLPKTNGLRNLLSSKYQKRILNLLEEFQPDFVYQRGKLPETVVAANYCKSYSICKFIWLSNADNSGEKWKFVKKVWYKRNKHKITLFPRLIEALYADIKIENAVKQASIFIAQTEKQKKDLHRNFGIKAVVLGSGHEIPTFFFKNNANLKILWLANLTPMKQPHLFAELAVSLKDTDVEFIMAGKAPEKQILDNVLEKTKNVKKFKYISGIGLLSGNKLFREADLFVSTSWENYEGLPNTFIQAFIHGVPVISLNHDPDGIIEKNNLGLVVRSEIELKQKVEEIIRNSEKLQSMSDNAYKFAIENFDIVKLVSTFLNIIQ